MRNWRQNLIFFAATLLIIASPGAFADEMNAAATQIKMKAVTLVEGAISVEVPDCWNIFQDKTGARITPNNQRCTAKDDGAELRIAKVSKPDLEVGGGKVSRIFAHRKDKKLFDECAAAIERSFKGVNISINCGPGPNSVTFVGYLKCEDQYFEIKTRDLLEGFSKIELASPDELPDRLYRTAFKTLKCKSKNRFWN